MIDALGCFPTGFEKCSWKLLCGSQLSVSKYSQPVLLLLVAMEGFLKCVLMLSKYFCNFQRKEEVLLLSGHLSAGSQVSSCTLVLQFVLEMLLCNNHVEGKWEDIAGNRRIIPVKMTVRSYAGSSLCSQFFRGENTAHVFAMRCCSQRDMISPQLLSHI